MAERLAFVEIPSQLAHVPSDYLVISLSPSVEVALKEGNRSFIRPEDYLDEVSLEEDGVANFTKVEDLCASLDAVFSDALPQVAEQQLTPARWHYFWLKTLYDAFFIRARHLAAILTAELPRQVLYFARARADLDREWVSPGESLYALLLDDLLRLRGISGTQVASASEQTSEVLKKDHDQISRVSALRHQLRLRFRETLASLSEVLPRTRSGRLLCLDYSYNTPFVAAELRRRGYEVWVWREGLNAYRTGSLRKQILNALGKLPDIQVGGIWKAVKEDRSIRDLFCWNAYDVWPVIAPRLERLVRRGLPEVLNDYSTAHQIMGELQPDAVFMSMASFPREKAVCHAARYLHIPPVVCRHGELGSHHIPMMIYQDIDSVDWVLSWGKWEAAWTRRWTKRSVSIQVTGAPMVEQVSRSAPSGTVLRSRLGLKCNERVVLYAPTSFDFNWRYISYRIPSDNSYFRQQISIISCLIDVNHCRILVKLPGGEPTSSLAAWVDRNMCGRVTCITDGNFGNLIYLPDVIVLDAPATTLTYAVQSSARIYIYNSWFHWEPGVLDVLRRTCVVSENFDEWMQRLRSDLISGQAFKPRSPDPELVAGLADPMTGAGGATRATAAAVEKIIMKAQIRRRTGKQGKGAFCASFL